MSKNIKYPGGAFNTDSDLNHLLDKALYEIALETPRDETGKDDARSTPKFSDPFSDVDLAELERLLAEETAAVEPARENTEDLAPENRWKDDATAGPVFDPPPIRKGDTQVFPAMIKPVHRIPISGLPPEAKEVAAVSRPKVAAYAPSEDKLSYEAFGQEEEATVKRRPLTAFLFFVFHALFYAFILAVILSVVLSFMRSNGSGLYEITHVGSGHYSVGDLVFIEECEPEMIRIEDDILMRYGDGNVLLPVRVLEVRQLAGEPLSFIIEESQGIAEGELVFSDMEQFVGKITIGLPGVAAFLNWTKDYMILYILLVAAVIFLFGFANWKYFRKPR